MASNEDSSEYKSISPNFIKRTINGNKDSFSKNSIENSNEDNLTNIFHKNEFFVITDLVPIETNTINNQLNIPNGQNSINGTPINKNLALDDQLIDIPLSPLDFEKNKIKNLQNNSNNINNNQKIEKNEIKEYDEESIIINNIDKLPNDTPLKEHNVIRKSTSVNLRESTPLNTSKPYIPPASTQLFPNKEELSKKELKKEKKIEKHILEAMQDHGNNINSQYIVEGIPLSTVSNNNNNTLNTNTATSSTDNIASGSQVFGTSTDNIAGETKVKKSGKKKRRLKKKNKHLEHKKNSLGETIFKGHPSWLLMRTIQTGLINCISKTSNRNIKEDSDEFFQSFHYLLPVIEEHPNMTFRFKDYCPHAFSRLRELFNIDPISYVHSICKPWNEVVTPGKSGSIFFFTHDNQYVLKTIPKREAKLLRSLLPEYYEHMKRNPNSLLTKFFGLHRVKPIGGRQVRFLVMKNLFYTPKEITQRFDLKGSTVGRELSPEELKKTCPTLKDLDFRRLGKKIHLGPDRKKLFMHQLSEDCKFLVKLNIMDYSLLIGLHNKNDVSQPPASTDKQTNSLDKSNINSSNNKIATHYQQDNEFESGDNYSTGDEYESDYEFGSDDDLRVSKKISSIKETKNYLNYFNHDGEPKFSTSANTTATTETKTTTTTPNKYYNNTPTSLINEPIHDLNYLSEEELNQNNLKNKINNLQQQQQQEQQQYQQQYLQQLNSSQYMKPVENPSLPPVLPESQSSPQPYIKPKISIFEHDKGGMQGINDKNEALGEYYFMGIIDILMLYSFRKQIEHTYKSLFNKGEVSSVDPVEYAARFINFIADIIV
ncbi:hypothetical protein DICPUDRAFT_154611 [Dictyostelium purpureum]|uniref:PIPK domain-containing protein n=1 Tax=Dictyostelium purpureum TaxID=5786 RepID=F0ZRS8_DICPU|nr:uncharacterized protein DICPUDRAFT_154611 [Dictyostelium purpureum]EGC33360.1 hypothetical protein DICPUDRAFT_154611 [Dictyostelium purpureum]|eukprot:XP_003290111.1 hypothetical protein DICPUDRAFT_154611 [Dictyostelium purpureum]